MKFELQIIHRQIIELWLHTQGRQAALVAQFLCSKARLLRIKA